MSKRPSQSEQRRRYAALYARVPSVECRGDCRDTCTEFPVPRGERRLVKAATGAELYADPVPWDTPGPRRVCPLLTAAGQCGAYDVRPLLCRLWGVVETMPCNYGCRPPGGLLSARVAYTMIAEAYEIGGDDRMAAYYRQILRVPDAHLEAMKPILKGLTSGFMTHAEAERRRARVMEAMGTGDPSITPKPR